MESGKGVSMNGEKTPKTEAEKWMNDYKNRTNEWARVGKFDHHRAGMVMMQLEAMYPHDLVVLVDLKGEKIGMRRVFKDRSYCDVMYRDAARGIIMAGVLSEGVIAQSGDGRVMN